MLVRIKFCKVLVWIEDPALQYFKSSYSEFELHVNMFDICTFNTAYIMELSVFT